MCLKVNKSRYTGKLKNHGPAGEILWLLSVEDGLKADYYGSESDRIGGRPKSVCVAPMAEFFIFSSTMDRFFGISPIFFKIGDRPSLWPIGLKIGDRPSLIVQNSTIMKYFLYKLKLMLLT